MHRILARAVLDIGSQERSEPSPDILPACGESPSAHVDKRWASETGRCEVAGERGSQGGTSSIAGVELLALSLILRFTVAQLLAAVKARGTAYSFPS
jgi:hypothetical protein